MTAWVLGLVIELLRLVRRAVAGDAAAEERLSQILPPRDRARIEREIDHAVADEKFRDPE